MIGEYEAIQLTNSYVKEMNQYCKDEVNLSLVIDRLDDSEKFWKSRDSQEEFEMVELVVVNEGPTSVSI